MNDAFFSSGENRKGTYRGEKEGQLRMQEKRYEKQEKAGQLVPPSMQKSRRAIPPCGNRQTQAADACHHQNPRQKDATPVPELVHDVYGDHGKQQEISK